MKFIYKKNYAYIILLCCVLISFHNANVIPEKKEKQKNIKALSDEQYFEQFDKTVFSWSKTIAESLSLIKSRYYLKVDIKDALIKSINALVSLDPHSSLLDPISYKEILRSTQGEFYGIGIVIDSLKKPDDEALSIIDTIPGGPADQAGILPEDKIVQVGDESVKGMTVDEIVAKLKGKRNTTVHIKVLRKNYNKLIPFDITRDVVKEQNAICFHFTNHNIYYLALNMFTQNAIKQLQKLLHKSQQQQSKGLILDLRYNTGGLLDAAIQIASLFLPKNSVVVVTKDRNDNVIETFRTQGKPITKMHIPIFILVNNYTASAAEILAGCLQEHAKKHQNTNTHMLTFVVGTTTFGKGSVQVLFPISNDCALKLTTSLYYLPNNISIQRVGVIPDFLIEQKYPPTSELKWVEDFFGHESALKNSIKPKTGSSSKEKTNMDNNANKADAKKKTWGERKMERISTDYQVLSTIRLIEMFNCSHKAYPQVFLDRSSIITHLNQHFNPQGTILMKQVLI